MIRRKSDIYKLKEELEDYYGTAMTNGYPQAMIELMEVENAPEEEIEKMTEEKIFSNRKSDYKIRKRRK